MKKLLFLFCFFFTTSAFANSEKVLDFKAMLYVQEDASVLVKEQITVKALGHKIKRGIYRDLPLKGDISYKALSVTKNGKPEPFFTEKVKQEKARRRSKGRTRVSYDYFYRINTGNNDFLPKNATYTYEITYEVQHPVLFFRNYDSFYWNVTGNGWIFPIEKVQAKVILPNGANIQKTEVYIGKKGSTESGVVNKKGLLSSPRPLQAKEGLTIKVDFDKGFISIPGDTAKNRQIEALFYLIFLTFFGLTWYAFGRDPEKRAIMPRFKGIKNLTPAQACWIYSYGTKLFDCVSLSLLQGAISGFFKIEEKDNFNLTQTFSKNTCFSFSQLRPAESKEEKILEERLPLPLELNGRFRRKFNVFLGYYKEFLKKTAGKKYFHSYLFLKILSYSLLAVLLCLLGNLTQRISVASRLLLLISMAGGLLITFLQELQIKGNIRRVHSKFIFSLVSGIVLVFPIKEVIHGDPVALRLFIFSFIGMISFIVYYFLIIQPTVKGLEIIEQVEGIKMFLEAMEPTQSKEVNLEQMEELLPYAVFFGLEKQWEEKMSFISVKPYTPGWYIGNNFRYSMFQEMRSSLNSSSGSGGGSSGGGAGGGGGGGR